MPRDRETTWLVVGASRGIGHEFVRQLLNRGDRVLATTRQRNASLDAAFWTEQKIKAGLCMPLECDVLSERSIDACVADAASKCNGRLDYVVLNAGILKYPNRATELSYDDFALHLHTNTVGPIIYAQRLLAANLSIGTIVFISSDSGSATEFRDVEDGFAAYAASKAALNHMARHMAAELRRKGTSTTILLLHPGEVETDMANIDLAWEVVGQMTPEESVAACIKTVESKTPADSGTFWTWNNESYPW